MIDTRGEPTPLRDERPVLSSANLGYNADAGIIMRTSVFVVGAWVCDQAPGHNGITVTLGAPGRGSFGGSDLSWNR